jgi:hypothetical protein
MATTNLDAQNFFQATLSAGISDTDTVIPLTSVPTPSEGYLTLESSNTTKREIIYYTSKGASSVTVPVSGGRGVGGTSAQAHSSGATVEMNMTADYFQALKDGTAIGDTNLTKVTTSVPKLINRQDNTTNTVVSNQLIQTGWGYFGGNDTAKLAKAVTFAQAFDGVPLVIMSYAGARATTPTSFEDLNISHGAGTSIAPSSDTVTTTSFNANLHRSDAALFSASTYFGFSWIAIGTKAR